MKGMQMNIRMAVLIAVAIPLTCAWSASAQVTTGGLANMDNETILAGFVGSSFGGQLDDESVDAGGSLSWLWSSVVGAEFLAGFAPSFSLAEGVDDTQINNYMLNAMAAAPLGETGRWQPFVSGGIGALTLRTGDEIEQELGIGDVDETELGGNVGFGVMGFADRLGVPR
jgi:hypothetical protein